MVVWEVRNAVGTQATVSVPTAFSSSAKLSHTGSFSNHDGNEVSPPCIVFKLCEKSDWLRAFNQFTIACELDIINAKSAADIAFIMSSSTSTWLLSPLECYPQKQNG